MTSNKIILNILLLVCLVGLLGCPSEREEAVEETPRQETAPQPDTTSGLDKPADTKTMTQETLQNQYAEIDQNIQNLQNKVEEVPEESKEEFNEMSQALQRQKNVAKERLDALQAAGSEGWEQLKASTEEALQELQTTYEQMATRFAQQQ